MRRGDIVDAKLGESTGSEQRGRRPVLVIQNDIGNEYSPTVIVASLTDNRKKWMPTHVGIKADKVNNLTKDSTILLEQIRTIDKQLVIGAIGKITPEQLKIVDYAIGVSIGLIAAPKQKRERGENGV